ncbi:MAG: tetratricopeptide repeat protein [bacterium]
MDEATELQQQVLEIARRALPPEHPQLRIALENMAELYEKSGGAAEAQALRQELASLKAKVADQKAAKP